MEKEIRIPIVNPFLCKKKKCQQECRKYCPPQQQGKQCIDIEEIAKINTGVCISCGLCVKKCPFGAIKMIKLPTELKANIVHKYDEYSFRLYRLPILKQGHILGIIGPNGIGKSTVINILAGKIRPNFENFEKQLQDKQIIKNFKGNELQKYLEHLYQKKLIVKIKPQNLDVVSKLCDKKNINPTIIEFLSEYAQLKEKIDWVTKLLDLDNILGNKIKSLSGGEMQRLMCALTALQESDVYFFDEPSNYLDVKQRLAVSNLIRSLITENKYVIVVEHDLSICDYICDYICIIYGVPSAYGIVSHPMSTAEAINIYLDGFIPSENMRFRAEPFLLKNSIELDDEIIKINDKYVYESFKINFERFELEVEEGFFPKQSSINVILGENGCGKTTFLNNLAEKLHLAISFKPQYLDISKFELDGKYPSVYNFLYGTIKNAMCSDMFKADVIKPLHIDDIKTRKLNELSIGELQRVMITNCLGIDANIYMIDEPSAFLDIEYRLEILRIIKKFILHNSKICFIIEHDMLLAVSFAMDINSQIIVIENKIEDNFRKCHAFPPTNFNEGINKFLKIMNITFRLDNHFHRPRINKLNSQKDQLQKKNNKYYDD